MRIRCIVLVASCLATGIAAPAAADSRLTVGELTAEHRHNPLGIDEREPRLGWKLRSQRQGEAQQAYRVQVASSPARLQEDSPDVWDSGTVASGRSVDVAYDGPALAARQRYWWRVQVTGRDGERSGWSVPAFFETGLLDDWRAKWIGRAADDALTLEGATWIWYPEGDPASAVPGGTRYFRRTFELPAGAQVERARMLLTADDEFVLYVNGSELARSPDVIDAWRQARLVDLTAALRPGSNTIAVAATNRSPSGPNPASWIGRLRVELAGGDAVTIDTDGDWRTHNVQQAGFEQPGFDDSGWTAAREVAAYGGGPWGRGVSLPSAPPPLARAEFTLSKPVARARLYASALGLYELRLNGSRVGDQVLAPGFTDYDDRVQYQTYDVTGALREGRNAIGAMLADGWYSGRLQGGQRFGDAPRLLAQLEVEYTDGTSTRVVSDDSWRTADGPLRAAGIYDGEELDARAEPAGWDRAGFDASAWEPAAVDGGVTTRPVAQAAPPIEVTQDLRPVAVTEPSPGVYVFDMGQNIVGWTRLRVRGPAGTTVRLRHAEVLNPDGTIYTANLRSARQTDTYTLRGGGEEVYEPRFTYHGFRYVEVTGYPGRPSLDDVTGRVVHAAMPGAGELDTSDPLLDRLQQNIVWGIRGNFLSVPTDCPQRDERLGWTGDAQMIAETASFNFDVSGFFTKWTHDLADAQHADGAFTDVAPDVCCGAGTAGWGDAGVIVPYALFRRYGDTRIVDRHWTAMTRWIDYLQAHSNGLLRPNQGYGDWLNVSSDTPRDVIGTAFFAWSTTLVAEMARATGRDADAARYEALARDVADAFNRAYVSADGTIKGDTQTAYVLALRFGLLPEELRPAALEHLVDDIESHGWHLSTGFLGTPHLLSVLEEGGRADVAYRLLRQDSYPSWLYQVRMGATTVWERWDSIRPDGTFQDPGMNSFNHYGFGAVGDWMYRSLAGIRPAEPGYRKIEIRPVPGSGLGAARGAYESPYGRIESSWTQQGGRYELTVAVPPNTTATVYVPADDPARVPAPAGAQPAGAEDGYAVFTVGSGRYTFRSALAAAAR